MRGQDRAHLSAFVELVQPTWAFSEQGSCRSRATKTVRDRDPLEPKWQAVLGSRTGPIPVGLGSSPGLTR